MKIQRDKRAGTGRKWQFLTIAYVITFYSASHRPASWGIRKNSFDRET